MAPNGHPCAHRDAGQHEGQEEPAGVQNGVGSHELKVRVLGQEDGIVQPVPQVLVVVQVQLRDGCVEENTTDGILRRV